MGSILDTVGLEIEAVIATREEISTKLSFREDRKSPIKSITRDASVESIDCQISPNAHLFLGNKMVREALSHKYAQIVTGYEIVTNPLEMPDMRDTVRRLLNTLNKSGEIYSPRASVHVHIGYPNGLIFLKTALALGFKMESLFFKLAGMGRPYRGEINHSTYARPLNLPPAVRVADSREFALLNPRDALSCDEQGSFWNRFGISIGERGRYTPLRYFAINLYSILLRGTLEFRFFNFSECARYIESVAALSQCFSDLATRISLSDIAQLPDVSIFSKNGDHDYIYLLNSFLRLANRYRCDFQPEPEDIESLEKIIRTTPQYVFSDKPVLTHLQNWAIRMGDARAFNLPLISHADDPGNVDIHNFTNTDRSLI